MNKTCDYWIDCDRPATVTITYKIKRKWIAGYQTETHRNHLCDECRKTIQENLPNNSFDFKESVIE